MKFYLSPKWRLKEIELAVFSVSSKSQMFKCHDYAKITSVILALESTFRRQDCHGMVD